MMSPRNQYDSLLVSNFFFNDVIKYFLYHSFATIYKAVIDIS